MHKIQIVKTVVFGNMSSISLHFHRDYVLNALDKP